MVRPTPTLKGMYIRCETVYKRINYYGRVTTLARFCYREVA